MDELDKLEHYAPPPGNMPIYIIGPDIAGLGGTTLARLGAHWQKHGIELVSIEEGLLRIAEMERTDTRMEIPIIPRLIEENPKYAEKPDKIPVPQKYKRNRFCR